MNNLFDLSGKTCVIIGGAGLIGNVFTRRAAQHNAEVIIAEANEAQARAQIEELKKEGINGVRFEPVDVTNPESMLQLAERVIAATGHVDGVVNVTYPRTPTYGKPFREAAIEDMLANLNLHIGGCFSIARSFAPYMEKQRSGSIVFMGSIYGIRVPRFELYEGTSMTLPAEYAAAKGGTIMLAGYFASLYGKNNVRVNAISPGGVADGQPASFLASYNKRALIAPGMLDADDLSGALIYLFSDASKKYTGQNIVIDGGWTI